MIGIGGRRFDRGGAIAIAAAVAVIGGRDDCVFTVGRVRREGAGAGVGRALVDVVVLGGRLGEVLKAPTAITRAITPATATRVAAAIDRRYRRAAEAASRGRRGPDEHHGSRRDQSRNHLTHYSLLLIFVCWI